MTAGPGYVGRFAPSPTGGLHAGSMVAALASWLDARASGGKWLIRIEDTDTPRCSADAAQFILKQLAACGFESDEPVVWQSRSTADYENALRRLQDNGHVYPCSCSRSRIERYWAMAGRERAANAELVYPGWCRFGLSGDTRARRLRCGNEMAPLVLEWHDRWLGMQQQNVTESVGDFVLRRADGLWAYQLAVVVDDGLQGVTHVVRGRDLADNTARQIHLQRLLGLPTPIYMHVPLVTDETGRKLSKQRGAPVLQLESAAEVGRVLHAAAQTLGLPIEPSPPSTPTEIADWKARAIRAWKSRWRP
jgi:glutamyl-Q tRNA(Asp) synthetase